MDDASLMFGILLMGLGIGLFASFLIKNAADAIDKIKSITEQTKKYKAKEDEVAKMKASGEMHEWIQIQSVNGKLMVCKKTGWCPELKGFIPIDSITTYLNKIKHEEEYKTYRNAKVLDMAKQLGLPLASMEKIVEDIFAMKKDFYLEKMKVLQEELMEKALAVSDGKQN